MCGFAAGICIGRLTAVRLAIGNVDSIKERPVYSKNGRRKNPF
jgi:hypothetical protein